MTDISYIMASQASTQIKDSNSNDQSFDDKVLSYIQQNEPDGTLQELMEQMRALSPDKPVSMQQLNKALLYSDTYLRNTEESKEYTDNVLDKHTIQLIGVNMLFNNMLYHNLTKSDEDTSF